MEKILQKGFTLIELLIVIAIIAVLAVGLIVAINPQDKIRSANDAKVLNDMGQIGRSADAYAAQNNGSYPSTSTALTGSGGELRAFPSAPTGYSPYDYTPSGCAGTACTGLVVSGQLMSNKYAAATPAPMPVAKWESATGKVCAVATAGTACP